MYMKTNDKREAARLTSQDSYDDSHCMDYITEENLPTQFAGNKNLAVTRMNTEDYKAAQKQAAFHSAQTTPTPG